nr:MAG TPA: hypothetical protein [Caudoviricetes sp.]DAZ05055.1 MAG TPA: hypothetical protein [Caudoviricetes sp.]
MFLILWHKISSLGFRTALLVKMFSAPLPS